MFAFRDAAFTFDAMAVTPSTRLSESDDHIVGLDGKGGDMANPLLVVMLHGIQPIGYFPISHSMEVSTMKSMIMDGVHLAHEAGIRVRNDVSLTS